MCVELLLEAACDIEAKAAAGGSTALHWAAKCGQVRTLRVLLDARAETSSETDFAETALLWAAAEGHYRSARLLLNAGADMNSSDAQGKTPLHVAAEGGHLEVVKLLGEFGAENCITALGETALHLASFGGHLQVVRYLLLMDFGTDMHDMQTDFGSTALHHASEAGHLDVAKLLRRRKGGPINQGWGNSFEPGIQEWSQGDHAFAWKAGLIFAQNDAPCSGKSCAYNM